MHVFVARSPAYRPLATAARLIALVFVFVVFNQCASTARTWNTASAQEELWEKISADISRNDPFSEDLTASGSLRVEGVGKGIQKLRARLVFSHPATLFLRGDKAPFGTKVLELTAQDNQWEVRLPSENHVLLSRDLFNGIRGDLAQRIEPAREIFDAKSWLTITEKKRRLDRKNAADGRLSLVIRDGRLIRRIVVTGPPWYIVEHHLSTAAGKELLSVAFLEFRELNRNGETVRFPNAIHIEIHPAKVILDLTDLNPQFSTDTTSEMELK